ncbi:MAG: hypothetical protein RR482_05905 [Clostridia bacterium]
MIIMTEFTRISSKVQQPSRKMEARTVDKALYLTIALYRSLGKGAVELYANKDGKTILLRKRSAQELPAADDFYLGGQYICATSFTRHLKSLGVVLPCRYSFVCDPDSDGLYVGTLLCDSAPQNAKAKAATRPRKTGLSEIAEAASRA